MSRSSSSTSASRPTSRSRLAAPRPRMRSPRPISFRPISSGARRAPRRSAPCWSRRLPQAAVVEQRRAADDHHPPAAAVPGRLPGGVHACADDRPGRGGGEDRRARVAQEGEALGRRLRSGDGEAAHDPRLRRAEAATRGLPVPGHVRLRPQVDVGGSRRRPARGVHVEVGTAEPLVRAEQEPHAVRRAHDRVDGRGRGQVPSERPLVAAVIYNRLRGEHAARDRRDAPLRAAHPADAVADAVGPRQQQPVQHAQAPAACRRRRSTTPGWRRSRRPRIRRMSTTSTSCASRITGTTTSPRTTRTSSTTRPRTATEVVLLGHPVEHSLSPRMQNAAFAAAGLDWEYVLRDVLPEELETAAVAREVEYANVTAPYKLDVARILGSGLPSVNTIVRGRGLLDGRRDPRASNELLQAGDRRRRRRGGGVPACAAGGARLLRRGEWPPEVRRRRPRDPRDAGARRGAVRAREGQTLIDLPYPRTATAEAAAAAGARVLDGLEVLVAQGAASFELWTGRRRRSASCAGGRRLDLTRAGA